MMSLRSPSGDVRERLFAEVMEIFAQALSLWGNPRLSLAEMIIDDGKVLREWPSPKFDEV
jgi:hypothetical protein